MKVDIKSGFGRGGKILRWAGGEIIPVKTVAENTWQGDGDDSFSGEIPDGQYIVGRYHTSGHTRVWHWELHGFSPEELSSPAPETGWRVETLGGNCCRPERVATFGDWLLATAGGDFMSDASLWEMGYPHPWKPNLRLVRLPLEWGDQAAEEWAVYRDGKFVPGLGASGCGDRAPEPITTRSGWEFESVEDRRRQAIEDEDRTLNAMFDSGLSEKWAEVGSHLSACYRRKLNPLPTLRKEHGGKWEFVAKGGFVRPVSGAIAWQGDGWTVIHTPA